MKKKVANGKVESTLHVAFRSLIWMHLDYNTQLYPSQ